MRNKTCKLRKTDCGYVIVSPTDYIMTEHMYFQNLNEAWIWANSWVSSWAEYSIEWENKRDHSLWQKMMMEQVYD